KKVFIIETFLFFSTLFLGVVTANSLNKLFGIKKILIPSFSPWEFIFYFFLATLFILILSCFPIVKKGKEITYKFLFLFLLIYGGIMILNLWLPYFISLLITTGLVFWWILKPSVLIHNLGVILGLAGAGAILGLSFSPQVVVFLLIIFSIYDYIAVYKTKHMVKMAKEMIETGVIFGLIIPQKFSDFKATLKEVKPGGRFFILGGGDVVFPLILCSSLINKGFFISLFVALFALFGFWLSFYFFTKQKTRKPIPALPPIALFSIIGFLIIKILW
ncbi:hypothetical protein J7K44_00340, partial [bacterium]|nr:hypothetical protein [bacterium]